MLRAWIANRRSEDEQRVLTAIGMLRPSRAGWYPISRLAHLGVVRTGRALERLEAAGRVTSCWSPGTALQRRRVYRIVRAVAGG